MVQHINKNSKRFGKEMRLRRKKKTRIMKGRRREGIKAHIYRDRRKNRDKHGKERLKES